MAGNELRAIEKLLAQLEQQKLVAYNPVTLGVPVLFAQSALLVLYNA